MSKIEWCASCPLGWNCAAMGLNPSEFCTNKGKCSAIAQTLHDENHPDPDAINALEYGNPYVSCNWYERGGTHLLGGIS